MPDPDIPSATLPWDNGHYSIKRHGVTIEHCEAEPIRTPGCIQAHGALLVLRLPALTILHASENSERWLGLAPAALLGQPVALAVGADAQARLRQALASAPLECNPLYLFSLTPAGGVASLDVSLHTRNGVGILEFEATGRGEAEPDYYALLKTILARLHSTATLADFCQRVAGEFHDLTGLDRVMVYRFHPDHHGEVFAESRRADLPPWLGLHYPAEDIPASVRAIFMTIWVRPLPDAQADPVELVPLVDPATGQPPDLTYCALRGASLMYTEYLRNMGVAASLTMPIRTDGRLWGLIACHHERPTRFDYRTRAICEFLAQAVSLEIAAVEAREQGRDHRRLDELHGQLIATAAAGGGRLEALIEGQPNLLDGLAAGGVALCQGGRWWRGGQTPEEGQLEVLADWLEGRPAFDSPLRPIYVTDALASDYPDGAALSATASGLLAVSLSREHRLFLLWFRPETVQTIHWAGNPRDLPTVPGPRGPRLTPRTSFQLFLESVQGRSLPWTGAQIAAALHLRLWAMELVVNRSARLAAINADLQRSNQDLDTFNYLVSYDLKEPLRGIANQVRWLTDHVEALGPEPRQRLDSLTRLSARMGSLLNVLLRFTRISRAPLEIAPVDLTEVVEEALTMAGARRRGTGAEVEVRRPLPIVVGDRTRLREVFRCLIDNALRYNDRPRHRVEVGALRPGDPGFPPGGGICAQVCYVRDNGIGIESAYWERVFDLFRRLHGRDAYGGGVGTGLAIARMLVERHGGRIWVESRPGVGSTFYFSLGSGGRGDGND